MLKVNDIKKKKQIFTTTKQHEASKEFKCTKEKPQGEIDYLKPRSQILTTAKYMSKYLTK